MPTFKVDAKDHVEKTIDGKKRRLLKKDKYESFNTSLLGLGDIRKPSRPTDSIAAVFDLEGFTTFSKQIEPHLSVPLFLNEFLEWLLSQIKAEMAQGELPEGIRLWSPLPYFVKYMGDGLLVLWDAADAGPANHRNIVVSAHAICRNYEGKFLPVIGKKVSTPPTRLRCGIARGTVFSVGDGNDFVGSCINMAARLQKLPGLSFAFNRRGFDLESETVTKFFYEKFVVRRVAVRGIGDDELIAVLKDEVKKLSPEESAYLKEL